MENGRRTFRKTGLDVQVNYKKEKGVIVSVLTVVLKGAYGVHEGKEIRGRRKSRGRKFGSGRQRTPGRFKVTT